MKIIRFFVHLLFALANIPVILLFVLSGYSDRISPETSLLFPYLGLVFPILFVANLCFTVGGLFLQRWRLVVASIVALLICWVPSHRYFPLHSFQELPEEGKILKVLTYNVMGFAYKDHTEKSPNPIISYINWLDADIVCLQEYAESDRPNRLTRKKIIKALNRYPYQAFLIKNKVGQRGYGLAVFSKYPIRKSEKIPYESRHNASSYHEIEVDGKKIALINNHLESFKLTSEDRSLYSSFITNPVSNEFEELRGSFEQKLGTAFKIRAKQAEAVAERIQEIKDGYILVCGDFNDTPVSYAHHTIQGSLKDAFAESGNGMGITYNQNYFWFRIDNILHSSNLQSFNCTVDRETYSDHYPLWCYIQLK